jgi:hypothetical protein
MRAIAVTTGYLATMAVYFALWKKDVTTGEPWGWLWLAAVGMLHLAAGLLVGRWWALLLPFAAILLAVPYGYGEGVGQEAPIWLYYGFIVAVPAALLVATGWGARRIRDRRR